MTDDDKQLPNDDSPRQKTELPKLDNLKVKLKYGDPVSDKRLPVVSPIVAEIGKMLADKIEGNQVETLDSDIKTRVNNLRSELHEIYGIKIPGIRFRAHDDSLAADEYRIMFDEVVIKKGNASVEGFFEDFKKILVKNLYRFVDHQFVLTQVNYLPIDDEKKITAGEKLSNLVLIIQSLLKDRISVKNFEQIYMRYSICLESEMGIWEIEEKMRLLPEIRPIIWGNSADYTHFYIGATMEEYFKKRVKKDKYGEYLNFGPKLTQYALSLIRHFKYHNENLALVIKDASLRRWLRQLVAIEFEDLPVLTSYELDFDLRNKIENEIEFVLKDNKESKTQDD